MAKRRGSFKKEFKRQIRLAIAAAIGFIIAFAWRDYVIGVASSLFINFSTAMPGTSRFLSASLLTIIGIILISISSKLLK